MKITKNINEGSSLKYMYKRQIIGKPLYISYSNNLTDLIINFIKECPIMIYCYTVNIFKPKIKSIKYSLKQRIFYIK